MSDSWRNGRQMTVNRQNRQKKKEVPNRDTGVGNGTQPTPTVDILDN
jgi:hypothetical protein